jgi:minichromosome maintenance protein 10
VSGDDDINDNDDEETLQLKLQALEARLKLKQLQNAKAKESSFEAARKRTEVLRAGALSAAEQGRPARAVTPPPPTGRRPISQSAVEVPVSPIRKLQETELQTSPRRVQLGIDKGLRAKDVSLRRAPSLKQAGSGMDTTQGDGYLRRSRTPFANAEQPQALSRPLSFNERMTSARTEEAMRAEKQEKVQSLRAKSFGIGQTEMDHYKSTAVDIPEEPESAPTFTREEVLSQTDSKSTGLKRSNTVTSNRAIGDNDTTLAGTANGYESIAASYEPYTNLHLTRRVLPHRILARHLSGKRHYHIKDLLKKVKAPDFSLPDVEQDVVVFGILAKKSEPRSHKPNVNANKAAEDRGKYMVMTLVDLSFEIELFLFNSGFTRFWKLTEGTVVAILNPVIMPPPPGRQATGRFSLVVNSDEDTIIEVGIARDLGYCKSIKKDGDICAQWINKKRTEYCEFHSNEAVRKTKAGRVEMNGFGFGGNGKEKWKMNSSYVNEKKNEGLQKRSGAGSSSGTYDRTTQSHWFAARSMSASDLIDGKDRFDQKEKEEHLKRRLAEKEKEFELLKKLSRVGGGAGREYMERAGSRMAGQNANLVPTAEKPPRANDIDDDHKAALQSLRLNSRDRTVHLSPIKRKRAESSQGGSVKGSTSNTTVLGWGTGLKDKLARMKEGEKLRSNDAGEHPPVRKKTRFVTEKGIRVAGRESLGADLSGRQIAIPDDDDDDELVIV